MVEITRSGQPMTDKELGTALKMVRNENRHRTLRWLTALGIVGGLVLYKIKCTSKSPVQKHTDEKSEPEKTEEK